jgi:hypothetical protein
MSTSLYVFVLNCFQVVPEWAENKRDAFEAVVRGRWLLEDEEFRARAEQNKSNRGEDGTHCAGNRNYDRFKEKMVTFLLYHHVSYFTVILIFLFTMQVAEAPPGEVIHDIQVYERMRTKKLDLSKPQPQWPEYFGHAQKDLLDYGVVMTGRHPEVEDPFDAPVDPDSLLLAGRGLPHGRLRLLNKQVKPTLTTSYTRLKSTLSKDDPPLPRSSQPRGSSAKVDVSSSHFSFF